MGSGDSIKRTRVNARNTSYMTNEEKLEKIRELDVILDSIFCGTHVYVHVKHLPSPEFIQYKTDEDVAGCPVLQLGYRKYLPLYHEHELIIQAPCANRTRANYLFKYISLDDFMDKMKGLIISDFKGIQEFIESICDAKHTITF
jgi:hypothetical protein